MTAVPRDCRVSRIAKALDALTEQAIAYPGREALGRRQAGDEQGGEHAVVRRLRAGPGQEFFDLIDDAVDIPGPDGMVAPRDLDESRVLDLLRKVAPARDLHPRVVAAMDDQG